MKPDKMDIIRFNSLLNALGIEYMKRDLIAQYSGNRTESTLDLKKTELRDLVADLQNQQKEQNQTSSAPIKSMRNKIFHYCHLMLWYKEGSTVLDYDRINEFCIKSGNSHKPLNEYAGEDLTKLVWQFEQVYRTYKSKKI